MQIGKVSEITYKRSVRKKLSSDLEGVVPGVDAAELLLEDITIVMSSNCILKWFPGCEDYYLQKTINQLYEKRGEPLYLQLEINIPIDLEEKRLGKIVKNFNDAVEKRNMKISVCRTYAGMVEDVIAHITVLGNIKAGLHKLHDRRSVKPGMEIVMAGSIAVGGTAVISQIYQDKLMKKFNPGFVKQCIGLKNETNIEKIVKIVEKNDTIVMHTVSDGGVFSAVWELASSASIGVLVDIKKIPVCQETVEVAELFDYNPYLMDGTGAMLIVCRNGKELVNQFIENGVMAAVIGHLTDGNDRVAINGDEKRYLEPPRGDEIYRFL
jgi:hydrogenase maturation factor